MTSLEMALRLRSWPFRLRLDVLRQAKIRGGQNVIARRFYRERITLLFLVRRAA